MLQPSPFGAVRAVFGLTGLRSPVRPRPPSPVRPRLPSSPRRVNRVAQLTHVHNRAKLLGKHFNSSRILLSRLLLDGAAPVLCSVGEMRCIERHTSFSSFHLD